MSDENDKVGDTTEGGGPNYATLDEIVGVVSEMVNKAITSRNKQVESKVDKLFNDFSAKFEERLSKLPTDKPQSSGTEPRIEETPVYKGLQKQLSDLQHKLETAENEKRAERSKARDKDLRQKLGDELVKSGIDPTRVRHAVGLLVDADKRIRYVDEDSDEVVFKDSDDQEVDFRTGLKNWVKSDDAKIYMPARGATGSGDRRPAERKGASSQSNNALEEVGMSLLNVLKNEGF